MGVQSEIPVIVEKPLTGCGSRKFQIDPLGDHLSTCTTHSGAKKAHDWVVDLTYFAQHTKQILKHNWWLGSGGQQCGCLWCWISASLTTDLEVALTLTLMDNYITLTIS
jgi:hypothetical protein